MHLGINLRKAFLDVTIQEEVAHGRKYHPVDTFIHEFCKVFGKHGTPEYGSGMNNFPDFLSIMVKDNSLSDESHDYYRCCMEVTLKRAATLFRLAMLQRSCFFLKQLYVF